MNRVVKPSKLRNGHGLTGVAEHEDVNMDEQNIIWPLTTNETSRGQNLPPLLDQERLKKDNSIHHFAFGERLGALAQMYLELSVPLSTALRAARADLRQLGD